MPTLLLLRHGQASFGASDYDQLSPRGYEQARIVADHLSDQGARIDLVLSGSLSRQRGTAEPIASAYHRALEIDPRWDEYDSDDILARHSSTRARQDRAPGSDAPEISSRDFQLVLERALLEWISAGADGPCTEPWTTFNTRVGDALAELGGRLVSGQTALVCTSGGVLAALCTQLLGVPAETFVTFNRVTVNAGITRVLIGRSGATLLSFNEQSHLVRDGGKLVSYR